jgi:hypothetical protein
MLNKMKSFGGNKIFTKIILGICVMFLFTGTAFAANSTSIRLQQPKSPTNEDTFKITFVALDTNPDQAVNVQCYKRGPTDADYATFGSVINLTNGGNTDICQVQGSIMNQGAGTYSFKVIATGSTNVTSNIVDVDFNNSEKPEAPINYSKEKPDNCTYKIKFKTANDSGRTIKVVLYRSTDSVFNVDSAHQVNSLDIGSDTEGSMTDNISPNCSTTYYYAIRSFDVYGNGSDPRGDVSTSTIIINPTTTAQTQGAIEVLGGQTLGGEVLGEKEVSSEAAKEVLGEDKALEKNVLQESTANIMSWIASHKIVSAVILIILIGTLLSLYRKSKKRVE